MMPKPTLPKRIRRPIPDPVAPLSDVLLMRIAAALEDWDPEPIPGDYVTGNIRARYAEVLGAWYRSREACTAHPCGACRDAGEEAVQALVAAGLLPGEAERR